MERLRLEEEEKRRLAEEEKRRLEEFEARKNYCNYISGQVIGALGIAHNVYYVDGTVYLSFLSPFIDDAMKNQMTGFLQEMAYAQGIILMKSMAIQNNDLGFAKNQFIQINMYNANGNLIVTKTFNMPD